LNEVNEGRIETDLLSALSSSFKLKRDPSSASDLPSLTLLPSVQPQFSAEGRAFPASRLLFTYDEIYNPIYFLLLNCSPDLRIHLHTVLCGFAAA
jgi:hypothetical protein